MPGKYLRLPLHRVLLPLVCSSLLAIQTAGSGEEIEKRETCEDTTRILLPRAEDRWIAKDKAFHVGASAAIVGLAYHSYHCQLRNPKGDSRVLAISLSSLCGIGKELWDLKRSPRSLSWKDLAADGVGILLGVALFTL